jgi:hypothetical protein
MIIYPVVCKSTGKYPFPAGGGLYRQLSHGGSIEKRANVKEREKGKIEKLLFNG